MAETCSTFSRKIFWFFRFQRVRGHDILFSAGEARKIQYVRPAFPSKAEEPIFFIPGIGVYNK